MVKHIKIVMSVLLGVVEGFAISVEQNFFVPLEGEELKICRNKHVCSNSVRISFDCNVKNSPNYMITQKRHAIPLRFSHKRTIPCSQKCKEIFYKQ